MVGASVHEERPKRFARNRFVTVIALIATLIASGIVTQPLTAQAADGAQFDAGNIISDAIFFDGQGFSTSEVQTFLDSKVAVCRSGYTCLRNYRQATPNMAESPNRCGSYAGSPSESGAAIIAKVGAACGINPKVLLVLLEKEQSLVSDTWPLESQYRNATGFACPDTAPCDPSFSGFFYQVYYAARQFKTYALYPGSYNYRPGQNNQILFNPNRACGSSNVFIQNQATANLYIYTPYQPNTAALGNLYGIGDSCSAYGNRNFWRIFTDWFGSTQSGVLFRSPGNPAVYVISHNVKHIVRNMTMFGAYGPTGGLTFVSDAYLNSVPTGSPAGRIIRDDRGGLFFIDSGIRLHFSSCSQVEEYGGSCGPSGYVQLTNQQVDRYVSGPAIQPLLGTREGPSYWITGGKKREILDSASLSAASLPTVVSNILTQNAVSDIPWGAPVARNEVVVQSRETGSFYFLSDGKRFSVEAGTVSSFGASAGRLSQDGLNQIPDGGTFDGSVKAPDGRVGLASSTGITVIASPDLQAAFAPIPVSQNFFDQRTTGEAVNGNVFVKGSDKATIYVLNGGVIRPIDSWRTFTVLAATPSPTYFVVAPSVISTFTVGPGTLTPGAMYRTPDDKGIYLIDGFTSRIPVSSFDITSSLGIYGFSFTETRQLGAYTASATSLSYGVSCGMEKFVGAGGSLHLVSADRVSLYPFSWTRLDSSTCSNLQKGKPAGSFIREPSGGIFFLDGGTKRHVTSMTRLTELGGSSGWLDVSQGFAAAIPSGPPA